MNSEVAAQTTEVTARVEEVISGLLCVVALLEGILTAVNLPA